IRLTAVSAALKRLYVHRTSVANKKPYFVPAPSIDLQFPFAYAELYIDGRVDHNGTLRRLHAAKAGTNPDRDRKCVRGTRRCRHLLGEGVRRQDTNGRGRKS